MKKLISLFLVIAMLSSFAIVVSAETKVNLTVDWYGTKQTGPASNRKTEIDWDNGLTSGANAGETIAAYIYLPENTYLSSIGFNINYDESILTYKSTNFSGDYEWTGATGDQGNGVLKVGAATSAPQGSFVDLAVMLFTVNASPVKTKDTLFSIELDAAEKLTYNSGSGDVAFTADEFAVTFDKQLTINGVQEPVKEFKVTATDDGSKTVVTVANKGNKTGKVYVATFVGGVLDLCQVKDLADGDLTFEGLTGDVKVYVWDNNMVPLLDTALDA